MKKVEIRTPESQLVTILSVFDPVQAELVKNMLEDHGVMASTSGDHQAGFTGPLPVEIIVRNSDSSKAKQFIECHFPELV